MLQGWLSIGPLQGFSLDLHKMLSAKVAKLTEIKTDAKQLQLCLITSSNSEMIMRFLDLKKSHGIFEQNIYVGTMLRIHMLLFLTGCKFIELCHVTFITRCTNIWIKKDIESRNKMALVQFCH